MFLVANTFFMLTPQNTMSPKSRQTTLELYLVENSKSNEYYDVEKEKNGYLSGCYVDADLLRINGEWITGCIQLIH